MKGTRATWMFDGKRVVNANWAMVNAFLGDKGTLETTFGNAYLDMEVVRSALHDVKVRIKALNQMIEESRHDLKQYDYVLLESLSAFHATHMELKGLYIKMLKTKVNLDFVEPP